MLQQLTEEQMRKELPHFVTDPANQAKVEALLEGRNAISSEETRKLSAQL